MTTMTAAVLMGHGGPGMLDVRTDWPIAVAGVGEVLVRVTAAALNNTDVWTREGAYGLPGDPDALAGWRGPVSFPRVQGGDIAGVVADVGAGASTGWMNRRVLVDPALYAHDGDGAPPAGLLGSEADGGFAEYVAVAAGQLHDMTDSPLSDPELACLPIAYGTAMGMVERAGLESGETVLVTGASGGVGFALVQLLAARGVTVVALTSADKQDAVRAAGATSVVTRDADDLAAEVTAATDGHLDAVADVAGGPLVEKLIPLLRDDGRWIIAGAVAGPVVTFDLRRLYLHNLRIVGSSMHTRAHFRKLAHIAERGAIRPRVAAQYSLTDIHRAQRAFMEHRHVGKIALTVQIPTAQGSDRQ